MDETFIIIQVAGGLGNQLFQLANAYQLSLKYNRKLFICDKNSATRSIYWDSILSYFREKLISLETYQQLKATKYDWAMRRFEYKSIELNPSIEYYCIEGYYQSYKYFDKDTFIKTLNIHEKEIDSVAIHIRRGDYTKNNFHKILSLDYYYHCLQLLKERIKLNRISIFSDDLEWCKTHFKPNLINKIEYVDLKTDVEEFIYMSRFKYIIIANSSFSWWAAHIGENKIVYCPKHWFNNGCHLNTRDLRPESWNIVDDDLTFTNNSQFNKNVFNIISLGSACCMIQNIHDNIYNNLGPLFRQPDNATNFFDWLITDFKTIAHIFENLMFRDDSFLSKEFFTLDNIITTPDKLPGGWSRVYRKAEYKNGTILSLHDIKKENTCIPEEFIDKYKRRFERLYNKIVNHHTIYLMHCFDFQWLPPYFPTTDDIQKVFESCRVINPLCQVKIYFFVHPEYKKREKLEEYEKIENVEVCYLKDKGFKTDWKANNLTFDKYLN